MKRSYQYNTVRNVKNHQNKIALSMRKLFLDVNHV